MEKTKYKWTDRSGDFNREWGVTLYALTLFDENTHLETESLPFLSAHDYGISLHSLGISLDKEGNAEFFTGQGIIDSRRLQHPHHTKLYPRAVLSQGRLQEAYDFKGNYVENAREFRERLTEYFESDGLVRREDKYFKQKGLKAIGDHLPCFINDSNLPEEHKKSLSGLLK